MSDKENMTSVSQAAVTEAKRSYFDGTAWQRLGWGLLGGLITLLSLGIAYPWAMCMLLRWEAKHTVINGRRLKFTGKGIGLWGRYLLWCLLTVVTLGIYSIWMGLGMKKWQVKHLVYDDDLTPVESRFTGGAGGWFGNRLLCFLVSVITLGIAYPWMQVRLLRWEAGHTRIGGSPLVFQGTGGRLLGKYLLAAVLTVITLGIYLLLFPIRLLKWKYGNTQALSCTPKYRARSRSHEEQAKLDYLRFHTAGNDAQLERMKAGVTDETPEEKLHELAGTENRSAMYELALRMKGEAWEGEAQELLRSSALLGWHPAMLDYAKTVSAEQTALYAELLTGSAAGGNAEAPWLLKQYYEALAHKLHDLGSYDSAEHLQKAAYWFFIAMECGDSEALENKAKYDPMVETVALWMTERRENVPRNRSGGTAVLVLVILLLLAGIGVCTYLYFVPVSLDTQEPSMVQLISEDIPVQEGTALFEQIPWEPGVVSFENFRFVNYSDQTATLNFSLSSESHGEDLRVLLLIGPVSEGDLGRVMAQKDSFVPLASFADTVSVEPGKMVKFAVIVYWPPSETETQPRQIEILAQPDIQ